MYIIQIDNQFLTLTTSMSILEACLLLKKQVPSFCYHPDLVLEGNCRMCLVEIDKLAKPQASCSLPIQHNMKIFTNTPFVKKARENVMEFLLMNHPLDCPICDQGGECDLQDQALSFGSLSSRYRSQKKNLTNKYYNKYLKIIMNRCITCTRCTRYLTSFAGSSLLGSLKRGFHTEIGGFSSQIVDTPFSGNLIEICPVGAITSKPQAFLDRPWENVIKKSIDFTDNLGTSIRLEIRKNELLRITPCTSNLNVEYITNSIRFAEVNTFLNNRKKIIKQLKKSKIKNNTLFSNFVLTYITKNVLIPFNLMISRESLVLLSNLFLKKFNYNLKSELYNTLLSKYPALFIHNIFSEIRKADTIFFFGISPHLTNAKIYVNLIKEQNKRQLNIYSLGAVKHYNDLFIKQSSLSSEMFNLNLQSFLKQLFGISLISKIYLKTKTLIMFFKLFSTLKQEHAQVYTLLNCFINTLKKNNQKSSYSLKTYQSFLNQTGCLSYGVQLTPKKGLEDTFINYFINTQNIQVSLNSPQQNSYLKYQSNLIPYIPLTSYFENFGFYQNIKGEWKKNSNCLNYNQKQIVSLNTQLNTFVKKYTKTQNKLLVWFNRLNYKTESFIFESQKVLNLFKKIGISKQSLQSEIVLTTNKFNFQYNVLPSNIFKTFKK